MGRISRRWIRGWRWRLFRRDLARLLLRLPAQLPGSVGLWAIARLCPLALDERRDLLELRALTDRLLAESELA